MATRFDRATIANHEKLPDGRLRIRASVSRVGDLKYVMPDGSVRVERVTADELFKQDSLDTAGLAPVTLGHPKEGLVTPATWKKYAVGATGSQVFARQDGGLVDVVFLVGDEEAIASIESGKTVEVSAGYTTEVEERSDGLYQTNRKYNHFALVERGRAGSDVRVHFDSAVDDWAIQADEEQVEVKTDMKMISMEVPASMAAKIKSMIADMDDDEEMTDKKDGGNYSKKKMDDLESKIDSLTSDLAAEKTRADSAVAQLETVQKQLNDRLRADAAISAKPFLPTEFKVDSAESVTAIYKAAIAHSMPTLKTDGMTEDAIAAAYQTMVAIKGETKVDVDPLKEQLNAAQSIGRSDSAEGKVSPAMKAHIASSTRWKSA